MIRKVLLVVLTLTIFSFVVQGQVSTGDIVGKVMLASGETLPGVTVTITGETYGKKVAVTTDEGNYRFLRLPPGNFELNFELDGFKSLVRRAIRVNIASTVEINVVMEPGTIQEKIDVTGKVPLIDTRKATISTNLTKAEVDILPTGRSADAVVLMAPGISSQNQGSGSTAIYGIGTRDTQNRWSLDGATVDGVEYGGTRGSSVSLETLEETQVSVSAHDITNITGGVSVNFVSKRGGNNYSGTFYMRMRDKFLTSTQTMPDAMSSYQTAYTKHGYYYGGGFGGPLWKDHLWFYGAFSSNDVTSVNNRGTESRSGYNPFFYGKLSAQYKMFSADFTYQWTVNESDSPYTTSSNATRWGTSITNWGGSWPMGINLNAVFGNLMANVKYTRLKGSSGIKPTPFGSLVGGSTYNAGGEFRMAFPAAFGYNFADPINSLLGHKAGVGTMQPSTVDRPYVIGTLNYFAESLLGGNHEITVGADYEQSHMTRQVLWPNHSYIFWNYPEAKMADGRIDLMYLYADFNTDKETDRQGIFFQDVATYGRLTVNLGMRYDFLNWKQNPSIRHPLTPWIPELGTWSVPTGLEAWAGQTLSSDSASLSDFGIHPDSFSPRLSLAYDLFGDGKTIIKASVAQYGGNLYNSDMPSLAAGAVSCYTVFPFKDANGNGFPDSGEFVGWSNLTPAKIQSYRNNTTDPFFSTNLWSYYNYAGYTLTGVPSSGGSVDTKVDADFSSPKINEIVAGVERQLTEDIAVSLMGTYKKNYNGIRSTNWYKDTATGAEVLPDQSLYYEYAKDPYTNRSLYKLKANYVTGGTYLTNYTKSYEQVYALEARFTKKMSNHWMLAASFDYQDYKRRWFQEDNPGMFAVDYFDKSTANPSMWGSAYIYPVPVWTAKVSGAYQLPLGFTVSAVILGNDGYPVYDYVGSYDGNFVPPTDRKFGDVRLPDYWQVNLGLEKKFALSDKANVVVSAQGYNVFNNTVVTTVNQFTIPQTMLDARGVTMPATWELSARIDF